MIDEYSVISQNNKSFSRYNKHIILEAAISDQPIDYKKMYHPFAEKLSLLEEWKQVIMVAIETLVLFITTNIIKNLFYYCW